MNIKRLLSILVITLVSLEVFGQAKKPIIMVIPSDNWMKQNGFIDMVNNQGTSMAVPNYSKAFMDNAKLGQVISMISGILEKRGFPPKLLEQTLKSINNEIAEEVVTTSKSGSDLAESPLDRLKRVAKPDIILQLSWSINQRGPYKSVSFNLQGIDAYTNKPAGSSTGTGPEDSASSEILLLEEAVLANIDIFASNLQRHFEDMFANGREVVLKIRKWNSWDKDLESEFEGKELNEHIEDWISKNTVKGKFSVTDISENRMTIEQVRIPLLDESGKATDTRNWARNLQRHLRDKFKIEAKLSQRGLGEAIITLGEK